MRVYAWRRVSEEPRFRTAKIASRRSCSPRGKLENEVSCPALLLISTGHFCWHRTCSEVSTNTGKVSLRKTSFSNYPRTFFFVGRSLPRSEWLKKKSKKKTIAPSPKPGWSRLVQTGLVRDQLSHSNRMQLREMRPTQNRTFTSVNARIRSQLIFLPEYFYLEEARQRSFTPYQCIIDDAN